MIFNHEDIKQRLPEYIREGLIPDEVKAHLKTCSECREEFSLITELNKLSVPEPGNMFFETLPQKVRISLRKKKSIFFRFAPAFVLIALVVVAGYLYHITTISQVEEGFLFNDPFAPHVYDLSDLSADDIPSIAGAIEEDKVYSTEETTFLGELASLNSEEMEEFYKSIKIIQKSNGGVL